ncbi:hypothetical protein B0H34DRAFT_801805 [Crassisporium funariophilum]|nr:hypothetical protein B0H34DRAFT_801805 [Crassisporium funariophilum]
MPRGSGLSYGFRATHSFKASGELQKLLGLEQEKALFEEIKRHIIRTAQRHLDLTVLPSKQVAALAIIKRELRERYPDIFDAEQAEKRLFFAEYIIRHKCALTRQNIKNAGARKHQGDTTTFIDLTYEDPNDDLDDDARQHPSRFSSPVEIVESKSTNVGRSTVQPRRSERITSHVSYFTDEPSISQATSTQSEQTKVSTPSALSTVASTRSTVNSSSAYVGKGSQIACVHKFLAACIPSMDHFLQRFIDFGCTNEEFLRGVSMWRKEKLRDFLERLLQDPERASVSNMELLVLENHFETYFSGVKM